MSQRRVIMRIQRGKLDGKAMPVGSYYYIIDTGTDAEDMKGIVTIVLE